MKKLIQLRQIKILNSIRALDEGEQFDIHQIMKLEVTLSLSQLLNKSQQLQREFTFNLQFSALKYRIKRAIRESALTEAAVSHVTDSMLSTVISVTLSDDDEATSMFCTV